MSCMRLVRAISRDTVMRVTAWLAASVSTRIINIQLGNERGHRRIMISAPPL